VRVQSTIGVPAGGTPAGGLKGMTGKAYLHRSRQLISRIQQLQREHRLSPRHGAREDGRDAPRRHR
jgi:hypothetical protein